MQKSPVKVGDILEVSTERLAYGGEAVARHDGLAIFIRFAAPGERLRVRITERKKNFARAVIERILKPSSARRDPPCQYFGDCGGCQLQHLSYDAQLEAKVGFIRDALERIGRIDWPHEIPLRHASEFGYRGRAGLKIDAKAERVGFNRAASSAVCDVESCPILVPELNEALASLRQVAKDTNARNAPGKLSEVEIAAGENGVSFEPSVGGLPERILHRTARGAVYEYGPSTFFQVNPNLVETLIDEAIGDASGELAIDLYAGVGLFTIQLARRFNRVVGVESDSRTAKHALSNLTANAVTNVEFRVDPVDSYLSKVLRTDEKPPDLVLLDPPRTGAAEAIPHITALKPARITYVSCDPPSLARDLRAVVASGYELLSVSAIDLFPQTYHVETVAVLRVR